MLQLISEYENDQISLKALISKLEGLIGVLQNISGEWIDLFRQK